MANLRIQVIGTSEEYVSKGDGKGYNKLTVTYKNLATTPAKVEVKNLMDFANKEVYAKLKDVDKNAVLQVTSEKINNFWNWTEVHRDDGPVPEAVETPASKTTPAAKAGSWEEKNALDREKFDFDKAKQTLIIRQSCLSTAVDFLKDKKVDYDQVIKTAENFEQWVNRKDLGSLKDMQDDIPL